MIRVLFIFITFFMIFFLPSLGLGQSNIDIIDSMVTNIINQEIMRYKSNLSDSIILKYSEGTQEEIDYLYIIAGNILAKNSFKVYRNYSQESTFQGMVFEVSKFTIGIVYSGRDKTDKLTRTINITLIAQLFHSKTGEIIRPINVEKLHRAEILREQIDGLERSAYQFTQGVRIQYTTWERVIEPLLIISSVAVMIFLLYTLRT